MEFHESHNELAMLQKPKQSEGFHEVVDFLKSSHISKALSVCPTIYIEHQRQFWENAIVVTEGERKIFRTRVCDKPLNVTEETIRISLSLEDAAGITFIPHEELFSTLHRMGYEGQTGVFTFYKSKFHTQWRFLVHTLMHSISKKTTGWSEFSSTLAYALVCLATSRKFNFSAMIFNDLVSNLTSKKPFYMYPRFVQEVIHKELTDLPHFNEIYVPKPPKGKVFSNMRRNPRDSEGVDTPLFPTMMVVSHTTEGMASGSKPSSDQPTDDQTPPSHSKEIPQSILKKPIPSISKTFERRKIHKDPSLGVSTESPKPSSPVMEHTPLQNIERESPGVSPNSKKVHPKEQVVHMGSKAATTSVSKKKASGNISKTFPMATQSKKLDRGPWCQETTGAGSASARQKTPATSSKDPVMKVKTSKPGEDSYTIDELMVTIGNINLDVMSQKKEIESLKKVVLYQQTQIDKQKKMISKLMQKKKKSPFILKRRIPQDDASKKGESEAEPSMEIEAETAAEDQGEINMEFVEPNVQIFESMAETSTAVEKEVEKENEREDAQEKGELNESAKKIEEKIAESVQELVKDAEMAEAAETKQDTENVNTADTTAESPKAVVTEPAVETVSAADSVKAAVTDEAAEMDTTVEVNKAVETGEAAVTKEAAVIRQTAVTVNTAELAHALLYHLVREIVSESIQEAVLRKAERLVKRVAEIKVSTELPKKSLKRTKMMAKKRKAAKQDSGERLVKRAKKELEQEKKEEEKKKKKEENKKKKKEDKKKAEEKKYDQYMIVVNPNPQKPIEATPLTSKPPEIIFWDTMIDEETEREYIRIKRADGQFDVQRSWGILIKRYTRSDIEEMHRVGMNLYGNMLHESGVSITKMVLEFLCFMFEPEAVNHLIIREFEKVLNWSLHENCAAYSILLDNGLQEYYLVDRVYRHSMQRLNGMLAVKLRCTQGSPMGSYLLRRILNQSLGLDPNLVVYVD